METKTLIKRIREASGMTQEQVAEAMGVSVNTVQNWERSNLFKHKDMLHDLLDLYRVDDVLRTRAVLEAFGRSENRDYFITEFFGTDDRQPSRIAVQDIYEQKDILYPYPIDQMISCLNAICTRLSCVQGAISFLDGYLEKCEPVIFCRESAIVIDRTCAEYGIQACAEQVYRIQTMDDMISSVFPFGDEGDQKEYVESYGREMTYNELFEKESAKISLPERSDPEETETALYELELEEMALEDMKYRVLTCLIQTGLYEGFVEKEYLVDAREESFWTLVHLRVTDQTFRIPSTVEEMEWALKNWFLNIEKRNGKYYSGLFCDRFCEQAVADQAIAVMKKATAYTLTDRPVRTEKEWVEICHGNKALKKYLVDYEAAEDMRLNENGSVT